MLEKERMRELLEEIRRLVHKEDCLTCECYQGYIEDLCFDADAEARKEAQNARVMEEEMHECLGCSSCPPAELHSEYIKARVKAAVPGLHGCCR